MLGTCLAAGSSSHRSANPGRTAGQRLSFEPTGLSMHFCSQHLLFQLSLDLIFCLKHLPPSQTPSCGHLHPIILSLPTMLHSAQALGVQTRKAPVTFSCSLWSVQPRQCSLPGGKFWSFIYLQWLKACRQIWDLPGAHMKQQPELCSNISESSVYTS